MRLDINGVIIPYEDKWVYDYFDMENTTAKDVRDKIAACKDGRLDVHINSPGGDLIEGVDIYSAIEEFTGEVLIHVVQACSAASVIACAGESEMTRTGLFMFHNVSGGARGDYRDMEHSAEVLKQANRAVCAAYTAKTGMSEEELLRGMDAETWLTAADAVRLGFIDRIAENRNARLSNAYSGLLPPEVIERMKNQKTALYNSAVGGNAARRLKLLNMKRRDLT